MPRPIHIHLLPSHVRPEELDGAAVVVIDVLRASTTICHALAAGAECVIPVATVEQSLEIRAKIGSAKAILGGERGGVKIEGFDLANSPGEYTPATVGGKTVIFTTTNGTQAMERCRAARRILIGAFANQSAVAVALREEPVVHLLCAGTQGRVTREDTLFAGALASLLTENNDDIDDRFVATVAHTPVSEFAGPFVLATDEARIAVDAWRAAEREMAAGKPLAEILGQCQGGRNAIRLGLFPDLAPTGAVDSITIVPTLNTRAWEIRSAS